MADYSKLTDDEFDSILDELVNLSPASHLMTIPGVYECVKEEYNNDVLTMWKMKQGDEDDEDAPALPDPVAIGAIRGRLTIIQTRTELALERLAMRDIRLSPRHALMLLAAFMQQSIEKPGKKDGQFITNLIQNHNL